jgi:glutathione S-transferase
MLEEMGEPYELIEKSTRTDELQSAEYLRLNPNARIPTLVGNDVVLWESMAINLYLAQKYGGPMHCVDAKVLGLAAQWSFWAMLEMEGLLLDLLQHRALLPEFARDASYAERDELLLRKPLEVLNNTLSERDHLVGGNFTVADLNVASILVWGKMGRLDLSAHPDVAQFQSERSEWEISHDEATQFHHSIRRRGGLGATTGIHPRDRLQTFINHLGG